MAICYPDYGESENAFVSPAEAHFYSACRNQLSDDFHLFHSVAWISRPQNGETKDGETDFLICHPELGLLVVEIKGGGIRTDYKSGKWYSTDRARREHEITNPIRQALRGKYSVLNKLKEHRDWSRLGIGRIVAGHAAFFPDLDDAKPLQGPDAPPEIIGDRSDMSSIDRWINQVLAYWGDSDREECSGYDQLGARGLDLIGRIFARVVEAKPLLSFLIAEEEQQRIRLTNQQVRTLNTLSRQRRVAISGGAGTGKTVLALEKAQRLAAEGFRTLLTCYNRPLADSLRSAVGGCEGLEIMSFHQLCHHWILRANAESGRNLLKEADASYPARDLYQHYYPIGLAYAADILGDNFDAIVVDEGQDFGEEYWFSLEMLLSDNELSPFYIFFDENQKIYAKVSSFPISGEPMSLTENCRNTAVIHEAAYHYYAGAPVSEPPIAGEPIRVLDASNPEKQAKKICGLITRLIDKEGFSPNEIAVLLADRLHRDDYKRLLFRHPLPRGSSWAEFDDRLETSVTLETVARFKGLESPIVVLWGLDQIPKEKRQEILYIGLSRAKSLLYLCGMKETCGAVLSGNWR